MRQRKRSRARAVRAVEDEGEVDRARRVAHAGAAAAELRFDLLHLREKLEWRERRVANGDGAEELWRSRRGVDRLGLEARACRGREELLQVPPRLRDGVDDSLGEFAVLEADRQLRGDLVPEAGRHFLVDAAVAEGPEALLLGGDEEQHAVARGRLGHAEALERPLGDEAAVAAARLRLHVHADLARGLVLRGADGLDDALLVEPRQELLLIHYQLPPAPPPPNELPPPPHEPPVLHPPPPPPPKPPPPNVVPPPPPQKNGKMQPLHPPQPPRRSSGRMTKRNTRKRTMRMTMSEPDGPGVEREMGRCCTGSRIGAVVEDVVDVQLGSIFVAS